MQRDWVYKHVGCKIFFQIPYYELGAEYFDRLDPERLKRYLVKRLERIELKVSVEPLKDAA